MNKSELLRHLRERHQEWEALLEEVGPARLERPGVNGDWSMKDIVAHLTGWNRWLVDRLGAAARGEPQPLPPWTAHLEAEDDINAWIYESNHGRSLPEVLEDSRQMFQELFTLLEGLPDDVRIETVHGSSGKAFHLPWLGEERFPVAEFFDHFEDDHQPDVRAWLARTEAS